MIHTARPVKREDYYWFHYREAGSYEGAVTIHGAENAKGARVTAPEVERPETVHLLLRVTDKGDPPLSRYERVIVTITP